MHADCLTVPAPGATLTLHSLGTDAKLWPTPTKAVTLLGSKEKLQWSQGPDALTLHCPAAIPFKIAVGFKIN